MNVHKAILVVFFCLVMLAGCGKDEVEKVPVPVLTKDMTVGVDVVPDYENERTIIFHGYFGLFAYDLVNEKITLAVDLKELVGTNAIQGSSYVNIMVNGDGSKVMIYEEGNDATPLEKKMVYYINTKDGTYTYDKFKLFDPMSYVVDPSKLKFEGSTINDLTYTNGKETWKLFENWTFK